MYSRSNISLMMMSVRIASYFEEIHIKHVKAYTILEKSFFFLNSV